MGGSSLPRGASKLLLQRGFPAADQTTGNYCLEAVDEWRELEAFREIVRRLARGGGLPLRMRRFPRLFPRPIDDGPKSDRETARARIANM